MNVFIVFVWFLGWIIAIWVRLARLNEKKGGLRIWKEGLTIKIKYIITIYIYILDPRGPGPYLGPSLDLYQMFTR